jgi:ferredoxin-NADP reductase
MLQLQLIHTEPMTQNVKVMRWRTMDGRALPAWQAGAHMEFKVELGGTTPAFRAYSLMSTGSPSQCDIAVQCDAKGSGGSRYMHGLSVGATLQVKPPANHFPLHPKAARSVLLAGGIGITPILSMVRELVKNNQPFECHFAARTKVDMPYREVMALLPNCQLYFDKGDPKQGIPIDQVLSEPAPDKHLYLCGPKSMIEANVQSAKRLGWTDDCIHYELFAGGLSTDQDASFAVHCAQSGIDFVVPKHLSILDVMLSLGMDPTFDCRTGTCGVCVTPVLEGELDHRDASLSARERAEGTQMCICVSRAVSPRLVLAI